jgi:hypothetical protein
MKVIDFRRIYILCLVHVSFCIMVLDDIDSYPVGIVGCFLMVKRPERETERSPPSCADIMDE